jgi:hypothetical protein
MSAVWFVPSICAIWRSPLSRYLFSQKMLFNVNVFGPLVKLRVLRQFYDACVVHKQNWNLTGCGDFRHRDSFINHITWSHSLSWVNNPV